MTRKRWLQWLFGAKKRYGLRILNDTVTSNDLQLRRARRQWVDDSRHNGIRVREPEWTESVAVGSEVFVENDKGTASTSVTGQAGEARSRSLRAARATSDFQYNQLKI